MQVSSTQSSTGSHGLEWSRDPGSHCLRCFGSDLPSVSRIKIGPVRLSSQRRERGIRIVTYRSTTRLFRVPSDTACSLLVEFRESLGGTGVQTGSASGSGGIARCRRPGTREWLRLRTPGDQVGESLSAVRASHTLVPSFSSLRTPQIVVDLDLSEPLQQLRTKRISAASVQHR